MNSVTALPIQANHFFAEEYTSFSDERKKPLPCATLIFQDILLTNKLSFTRAAIRDRDVKYCFTLRVILNIKLGKN